MDLATFRQRLAQCGADLDRWPGVEAEAARRLIAASPQARESFVEALSVEAPAPLSERDRPLVDRIMGALGDDGLGDN